MNEYDPKQIEKKWQEEWKQSGIYRAKEDSALPKHYFLVEFPYPSGNLHVGHWYAFSVPDIAARFHRMQGKNVMFPIGFDAFGLPAENAAIQRGLNPRDWTLSNIEYMKNQLRSMGASFDWSREVVTCLPEYYKWTQWMFLQFFNKGLAYQGESEVNWCPKDKTVLANEQVVDGKCERCGAEVVQKKMLQWNLKITDYADRLLEDAENLDWPKPIKEAQKNWIGKSEGAEIEFEIKGSGEKIKVFTTRPDTLYGATFLVKAGEKDKFTGEYAINPATKEEIPIWEAEYVYADYGTGAIMGVPAHDDRDFAFAKKHSLPIREVVIPVLPDPTNPHVPGKELVFRRATINVVYNPKTDEYLTLRWKEQPWITYVTGGIEEGEDPIESAKREIAEETGYTDVRFVRKLGSDARAEFYAAHKGVNRVAHNSMYLWELASEARKEVAEEEKAQFEVVWVPARELSALKIQHSEKQLIINALADENLIHAGGGVLINSGEFSGTYAYGGASEPAPHYIDSHDPPIPGAKTVKKKVAHAIIESPEGDKVLILKWHNFGWVSFVSGGIEGNENSEAALRREIKEETGYTDIKEVHKLGPPFFTQYHAAHKGENREAEVHAFYVKLASLNQDAKAKLENEKFDEVWVTWDEAQRLVNQVEAPEFWKRLNDAGRKIVSSVGGRWVTKFKVRDWVVSRQRYWGVPIPIIHCEKCGAVPEKEENLPVVLPEIDDYLPRDDGKSPLAKARAWAEVKCPKCGSKAERETDTLDTFVDSSWYFLRYADPKNEKTFASPGQLKKWLPVDFYSGGAEHTTMHLLYSRFWHKALFDLGLVFESEPYLRRMNRGLILGPDGQKMSKSKGNVIDPDKEVERFGADTVRTYLAFIGPFNEVGTYPWNPDSVVGVRRFLERVWKLKNRVTDGGSADSAIIHQTVKKVGEEIVSMKMNTAVSALMILVNDLDKQESVTRAEYEILITLLAPFAPHITEELWHDLGHTDSIHIQPWPQYDETKLVADTVTIVVQVNGKVRGDFTAASTISEAEAVEKAKHLPLIAKWIGGKEIKRAVYVPGKLVNFVVA